MTFDDLQQNWQQSNEVAAKEAVDANAVLRTVRRVEKSNSGIFRRDWIETAIALVLIYWFGRDLLDCENMMVWTGKLVCVCGMIYIIYKLHSTRSAWGTTQFDLTVREYYELEVQRVEKQIGLLRSVAIWYLAPCFVGVNLIFAGLCDSLLESFAYFVFVLLLYWGIYALNQFGVDQHFVPLYEQLKAAQRELDVVEDQSNTQSSRG